MNFIALDYIYDPGECGTEVEEQESHRFKVFPGGQERNAMNGSAAVSFPWATAHLWLFLLIATTGRGIGVTELDAKW